MTKILQIDREAAADLGGHPHQCIMRKGEYDNHPYIQKMASHREQATAELYEALTEAARYIEGYRDMPVGIKERINAALAKASPDA